MSEKISQKPISINKSTHQLWRNVAIGIIVVIVFLSLPNYCSGDCEHDHHHHVNEPASFKWSQQANEHHHEESENFGHHHHHHKTLKGIKIIFNQKSSTAFRSLLTENYNINFSTRIRN